MKCKLFETMKECTDSFFNQDEHTVGRVFNSIMMMNGEVFTVQEVVKVGKKFYLYKNENELLGVITPKGIFIGGREYRSPLLLEQKWLKYLWS